MNSDFLFALGARIAPGMAELDPDSRERVKAIVEHAIAARPPALQRQLGLFLNIVRWTPLARYGRRFDRLPPAQQDAVLRWFHDAPLRRFRQGFWGVKTVIYMGYYGRSEAGESIGYRPSRSGNDLLDAR